MLMDRVYLRAAKARLVEAMDRGVAWEDAAAAAGLLVSRATAYRLWLRACCEGTAAFEDGRHGHPAKTCAAIRTWLVAHCHCAPHTPSHELQRLVQQHFGITISVRQLNRVRAALGVRTVRAPAPKKT
jgi:transposase